MLEQTENAEEAAQQPARSDADAQLPAAGVDVAQLADKVYRLMQADLRLSLARGERLARPGARRGTRA